jgi:hypothetical protein
LIDRFLWSSSFNHALIRLLEYSLLSLCILILLSVFSIHIRCPYILGFGSSPIFPSHVGHLIDLNHSFTYCCMCSPYIYLIYFFSVIQIFSEMMTNLIPLFVYPPICCNILIFTTTKFLVGYLQYNLTFSSIQHWGSCNCLINFAFNLGDTCLSHINSTQYNFFIHSPYMNLVVTHHRSQPYATWYGNRSYTMFYLLSRIGVFIFVLVEVVVLSWNWLFVL